MSLVVVGAGIGWRFSDDLVQFQRQLAPTATTQVRLRWMQGGELNGAVLPLNPCDAGWLIWGNPQLRPVLDDRLDLFADDYAVYRQFCADVVHGRHTAYRRTDGSVGGWRQMYDRLRFDWIVSRASDVEANQMLSAGSYWAPVYWDAEAVVFGLKQHPAVMAAAKRMEDLKGAPWSGTDGDFTVQDAMTP